MSLIVLNSKGSDPEDFSNFMTEQIKFPKDAEVCLVSSNINRRMMIDSEAQIAAGSNSIGFQLGHGGLLPTGLRDNTLYTPHSPFMVDIETAGKNFPIQAIGNSVGGVINASFNNPSKVPISNIARGWASGAGIPTATDPFTMWNTPKVPSTAGSENSRGNWNTIAGKNNIGTGGINTTQTIGGLVAPVPGAPYATWVKCEGNDDGNNFVDLDPLWNTANGARATLFTPLASNQNISGGGWTWRMRTDGADITQTLAMRGGIFSNADFTNQDIHNVNSDLNRQSGGTAYTIWWEITDPTPAAGTQVDFYARKPGTKPDLGVNSKNDPNVINWARQTLPPAPGDLQSIGIRPILDTTGATPVFSLEAYTAVVALATNTYTTPPAAATLGGLPGILKISDPRDPLTYTGLPAGGRLNFDLYRHLPLRMGCNTGTGLETAIYCSAIHHDTTDVVDMGVGAIGNYPPYTFLLGDIPPLRQAEPVALGGSWDAECRQILRKSTLASVLGYNTHYGQVTAAAMLPAQAGLPAQIDLGLTRPATFPLVVTLPDLPITGYYGNSSGDGAAGTLNMNSGGNSAAIVGIIPSGDRPYKEPEAGIPGGTNRGEFFACPMENWICLNNPTPFSITSCRVRITDALGNKPMVLDSNSTITIKIKKRGSDTDFRQGGMNGVFTSGY